MSQSPAPAIDEAVVNEESRPIVRNTPWAAPTWWLWATGGVLVLLVSVVYGQTIDHQFLHFDDDTFVYNNPDVSQGFTRAGLIWAFTDGPYHEWYPLASLSHMLDCQLFGVDPAPAHLHNLLLHAAAATLLFLALLRLTRDYWPSAWAAAVFAVHPLHVSSVAWVSERRELMGGIFFMLTLWAYARYVERRTLPRYLTVAGCLAVGLMCKGMLVTVPCVLLLLDYWPLGRWPARANADSTVDANWWFGRLPGGWQLIVEKLPLFGLVALDCAMVFWKHLGSPVVAVVDPVPFLFRVANALVAYAAYLGQSFLPIGLSPYYPHLGTQLPLAWACEALALLVTITVLAAIFWRRLPFLVVGWFWFLGMLVPVLGLVGWFLQARADNYTYLSQIGLTIAVAWSGWHLYRWRQSRGAGPWLAWTLVGMAGVAVVLLAAATWRQTTYWRTTESVWLRVVACTEQSELAHYSLGLIYEEQDRLDEAIAQYDQALLAPSICRFFTGQIHAHLSYCLVQQHRDREAFEDLRAGLRIDPEGVSRHTRLDDLFTPSGKLDETAVQWREVVRLLPDWVNLRLSLADALLARGEPADVDEAFVHFDSALALHPQNSRIHFRLGLALLDRGQGRSAVEHLLTAIEIQPDDVSMLRQTAWILATHPDASVRDGARATELADRAMKEAGNNNPQVLDVLAAAQAETGQFDTAVKTAQAASALAQSQSKLELAAAIAGHLHQYEQGLAYRDKD